MIKLNLIATICSGLGAMISFWQGRIIWGFCFALLALTNYTIWPFNFMKNGD
jgi:hypothetical protein